MSLQTVLRSCSRGLKVVTMLDSRIYILGPNVPAIKGNAVLANHHRLQRRLLASCMCSSFLLDTKTTCNLSGEAPHNSKIPLFKVPEISHLDALPRDENDDHHNLKIVKTLRKPTQQAYLGSRKACSLLSFPSCTSPFCCSISSASFEMGSSSPGSFIFSSQQSASCKGSAERVFKNKDFY